MLPGFQRLLWIGNDNHTVVAAGATLEQLRTAPGIPFSSSPDIPRVPEYIQAVCEGRRLDRPSPQDFCASKVKEAERCPALRVWRPARPRGIRTPPLRYVSDTEAVLHVACFYHAKVQAAIALALSDKGVRPGDNAAVCLDRLRASVDEYRALTDLTARTYESISDVPAWKPYNDLPCPFHWRDILPRFEAELAARETAMVDRLQGAEAD